MIRDSNGPTTRRAIATQDGGEVIAADAH